MIKIPITIGEKTFKQIHINIQNLNLKKKVILLNVFAL